MSRTLHISPGRLDSRDVQPSEMTRAALGYIGDPKRWVRGDFFDDDDGSCAMGAFARTSQQEPPLGVSPEDFYEILGVLVATLRENFPDIDADTLDGFNDHPSVQHKDMVAAFEKTAAFFEEKGR